MDSGVGRRNDDGSPAVASTSRLQQQGPTASAHEFAARLNAIRSGWQESTEQKNTVTPQVPSQAAVPRSMHAGGMTSHQAVPSQWSSTAPTQLASPTVAQNSSVPASSSLSRSHVSTAAAQAPIGQQQSQSVAQEVVPTRSARSNTEIWRMALQMNPDERQIFLDEEMRKLAESSPAPQTLPPARRSNAPTIAQAQATNNAAIGRVQAQWNAANQVIQLPAAKPSSTTQHQQQRWQSVTPGTNATPQQPLRRTQPSVASPPQQTLPQQQISAIPNNTLLTSSRQRAVTVAATGASPVQQPQTPAAAVQPAAHLQSDAVQGVIQRLLPRGYVSEPRFVPRQVSHFSDLYEGEVKRYAVRPSPTPSPSTSIQSPDDTYERLKVRMDATPVSRLLKDAAGGIGRLAGLLPATDLLDREAHSTRHAIVTLVNAMRDTESNMVTVMQKNRVLEEQIVAMRKELAAYRPILDAVLQGVPQAAQQAPSSGSSNHLQIEQGSTTGATANGRVSQVEEASAQTTTPPAHHRAQDLDHTRKEVESGKETNVSSSTILVPSASRPAPNENNTSAAKLVETTRTDGAEQRPSHSSPVVNTDGNSDMQIDSDATTEATAPLPQVKNEEKEEEEELRDELQSPKPTRQARGSTLKHLEPPEPEAQDTPLRTLRSASQKVNTPIKDGSPARRKRKRSMQSSFQIHRGRKVECIDIDSSDEEGDDE